ncbi:N-6 DNA methylase [Janibacter hoylei PVAS-1]|uniref:site-specific DNA-methyltransferase (adenine-specific) n=1 Tax=Janibacter hoylei PVAS-1 TaxID=1210046 RepID=K1E0D9_9MICO|nr:class I SAM-dependent DNA methyltransferase [Janibacter hoylei]EKA62280.1 N-6 DNA methylase [Janibacter hoylei PVAS-1]RWU85761.1 SAM-dependent DNA methyltransferase [Janibacter hoylei PVAS-1]
MSVLSNFVWSVADTLRGPYSEAEYGSVILPFTVLRRLECVMAPHREAMAEIVAKYDGEQQRRTRLKIATRSEDSAGLAFWTTSDYTLQKALQDPDNLAENLIDYVGGFSGNLDVFKSFDFENVIRTLDARNRLAQVVRHFEVIDMSPDNVSNADMGDLFENLIYRFAESANDGAGQFYTPRDVVRLLVDLVYADDTEALRERGAVRSIYDPTVGTGGMLTVADEHLHDLNPDASTALFGQEINPRTYAICKADLLIKGQDPSNVRQGDTLVVDRFEDQRFDYVLSNPPFGTDWKAVEAEVKGEHVRGGQGRFAPGLPAVGDAAMLFLLHVASKMRDVDDTGRGGRAGIVLNGSPLFNGGAGSGPSEIRGHMLENDLVEAIVALPNDMFYNTGIATYLWILTNAKPEDRKGQIRLIDATELGSKLRKSIGSKRVEIAQKQREAIVRAFADQSAEDDEIQVPVKVFSNRDFAYWTVTVERPLQLRFQCTSETVSAVTEHKTLGKVDGLGEALESFGDEVYLNREKFNKDIGSHLRDCGLSLTAAQRKALWQTIGVHDEAASVCLHTSGANKGEPEPDPALRDTENVPFGWGGCPKTHEALKETVQAYFDAEVKPHVDDAWIDWDKTKTGYEIPFTRHFYTYEPPRPLEEIDADLERVVGEIMTLLREVEG